MGAAYVCGIDAMTDLISLDQIIAWQNNAASLHRVVDGYMARGMKETARSVQQDRALYNRIAHSALLYFVGHTINEQ